MNQKENQMAEGKTDGTDLLTTGTDFIAIENLRLSQSFSDMIGVKKALLTVPVRKPNRQEFVRVRPGDEWCLQTAVLELKEERDLPR